MLMETCALAFGADAATRAAKVRNAPVRRSVFHPRGRSLIPGLPAQDGRAIFI
jgi:hypothetical protein